MRVLLLGAAGHLGRYILRELLRQPSATPAHVTVLVRSPQRLRESLSSLVPAPAALSGEGVTVVEGSVSDTPLLERLMSDANVCIMTAGRPDPGTPADAQLGTLFPAVVAAARAHLQAPRRLLCLGGLGVLDAPGGGLVHELPGFPATARAFSVVHEANLKLLRATPAPTPSAPAASAAAAASGPQPAQAQAPLAWTMFAPGVMTDGPAAPISISVDHAPFYDPSSAGGKLLSSLPRLASLVALGAFKGRTTIPYASLAQLVAACAMGTQQQGDALVGKRVGVYLK